MGTSTPEDSKELLISEFNLMDGEPDGHVQFGKTMMCEMTHADLSFPSAPWIFRPL
jgi:hypothetical protein